jgi:PPM family protein phosphatase
VYPRGVSTVATIAGLTDAGVRRTLNEDTFRVTEVSGPLSRGPEDVVARLEVPVGLVLGVYDGTGGPMRGEHPVETGARLVAHGLASWGSLSGPEAIAARLAEAVAEASDAILERSRSPDARGGGTTATVAVITGEHLLVAQVGDSRAYRLRGRELVRLTEDDTLLQHALRTGQLRAADAADFPHKTVLLQVLGSPTIKVVVSSLDARHDDVILLCTDGIHGYVGDQAIRAVLLRHRAPGVAARVLLDEALRAGGHDNIALVVARFDGGDLETGEAALELTRIAPV